MPFSTHTDPVKSKGKADKTEKADNYNNYVRKNLKSGGSSKKLNRTTSRTSMAKQRWMNRNNETGNNGGGKYGKFSKYKKGGGYSGGNDNDDNNTGSASNNNSYNKPRGLQQWGLDALEMSLNLIEQQQQAMEQDSSGDNIITTENATTNNTSGVMDKNNVNVASAEKRGGIVLEDSEGEDEGDNSDYESVPTSNIASTKDSSAVAMEIDPPIQSCTVSRSGNGSSQAMPSASTTATSANFRNTSTTAAAAKSLPTTTTISTTYPTTSTYPVTSLLSSIRTNRANLSKQSAKLHKAELKQAQRILENERVTNMTLCAPKCPGHSMPSKLLVVKKSGANKVYYLLFFLFFNC